uniref:Uncharacterized protein n=1 Tax=Trichobilharzia regenti TaxID=157069 RepID=A0AA85IZ73_TRIRE|nr:unnamed protein product [Trichobilharzia regenti]
MRCDTNLNDGCSGRSRTVSDDENVCSSTTLTFESTLLEGFVLKPSLSSTSSTFSSSSSSTSSPSHCFFFE